MRAHLSVRIFFGYFRDEMCSIIRSIKKQADDGKELTYDLI